MAKFLCPQCNSSKLLSGFGLSDIRICKQCRHCFRVSVYIDEFAFNKTVSDFDCDCDSVFYSILGCQVHDWLDGSFCLLHDSYFKGVGKVYESPDTSDSLLIR